MLKPHDVIKMVTGDVWFVERCSESSAFIRPFTAKKRAITTRKGITKMVMQHGQGIHIASDACVSMIDPDSTLAKQVRRYFMSEETAPVAEKSTRSHRVYVRTEKEAKGMRGQGAIVLAAIDEADGKQGTIASITEACAGKFTTKQDDARIVGFYLSKFKREGLVVTPGVSAPEEAPAQAEHAEEISE